MNLILYTNDGRYLDVVIENIERYQLDLSTDATAVINEIKHCVSRYNQITIKVGDCLNYLDDRLEFKESWIIQSVGPAQMVKLQSVDGSRTQTIAVERGQSLPRLESST